MHVLVAVYLINRDHCKSLSFFERRGVLLMVLFVFCTSNHYNSFFLYKLGDIRRQTDRLLRLGNNKRTLKNDRNDMIFVYVLIRLLFKSVW